MQNPWLDLPTAAPFVAPVDSATLTPLARRLQGAYELKLDMLPQPWTGHPERAEVFVLALNPGFKTADYVELDSPDYAQQWRLALSFRTRTPFYFLDPAFKGTGGYRWWHRRLGALIDAVGLDAVSDKVMCIEHFPYKSVSYKPLGVSLPSQRYSFELLREAITRQKQIVVMRSERLWLESVPELRAYKYIRLSNHQNPYFSRAQMTPEQFDRLSAALRR